MKFLSAFGIVLLLLSASCSQYSKVLKSDDYEKKIALADDKYLRGKWLQSIALYEQVYQRFPKTSDGETAYFRIGKAYYEEGDYYMAGYYFGSFFERFNYSKQVEEAYFMRAVCSVKNSPEYSLDQQDTEVALNELQQFIYLFPNSKRIDTCNQIMDNLRLKIEKKSYEGVRLYAKTMNYRAAAVSADDFIQQYPNSKYHEEVLFLKLKNKSLLAFNSVEDKKKTRIDEAIETYRTFVAQFPSSKSLKEAESLHESLQGELKTLTNSK